jgi:hypothetical protein
MYKPIESHIAHIDSNRLAIPSCAKLSWQARDKAPHGRPIFVRSHALGMGMIYKCLQRERERGKDMMRREKEKRDQKKKNKKGSERAHTEERRNRGSEKDEGGQV